MKAQLKNYTRSIKSNSEFNKEINMSTTNQIHNTMSPDFSNNNALSPDASSAVTFLKQIRHKDEFVEIRLLDAVTLQNRKPHTLHAFFGYDEIDVFPKALTEANIVSAKGIYYSLNAFFEARQPRCEFKKAATGTCIKDSDVLNRDFLPIDLDPVRPNNCASTEAEHANALQLGREIVTLLQNATQDVQPFIVDSGNGCQILYHLSDALDASFASATVYEILSTLNALCKTDSFRHFGCDCDTSVSNPSRIMRLPGTMNCKGKSTDERPHRQAQIISSPSDTTKALTGKHLSEMLMTIKKRLLKAESRQPEILSMEDKSADPNETESVNIPPEQAEMSRQLILGFMHQHFPSSIPNRNYYDEKTGMHGTLWSIMCPLEEHENQSACVILWEDGHVIFRCQHDHCRDYRWADLVQKVASSRDEANRVLGHTISNNLGKVAPAMSSGFETPILCSLLDIHNALQAPLEERELIKDRYLLRGQVSMLVAEAGIGKSSLSMQFSIFWAMGKACFGLVPTKPLRILIIQAENDKDDLCESRDGIVRGIVEDGIATLEEVKSGLKNITTWTTMATTGREFAASVSYHLKENPFDLVIIDPLLHYIGADMSSQKSVGEFLRQMIYPIAQGQNTGILLIHHTPKPAKMKSGAENPDYNCSYDGAGSSEFANFCRGVLVLSRRRTDDGRFLFALIAGKRGERLRWTDASGKPTNEKWLQWHDGFIYWEEAPSDSAIRTSAPARRLARKNREKQEMKQTRLGQFKECLQTGEQYSHGQLQDILHEKEIETNTLKKDALIQDGLKEGWLERTELTKDEKQKKGFTANTKRIYQVKG